MSAVLDRNPDEWLEGSTPYKELRAKIIWYFRRRGQESWAEELADEVLTRALVRISSGSVVPDFGRFCFGICGHVLQERRRRPEFHELTGDPESPDGERIDSQIYLDQLLVRCSAQERDLLREYYLGDDRKELAKRLGITENALRVRIFQIKQRIKES